MSREEEVTRILAVGLRRILEKSAIDFAGMEEIRLRVDQPFMVVCGGKKNFVSDTGEFCPGEEAHRVTLSEIGETVDYISSYSRYAFEEKIRQGFLTIQGGHRVGLCGRTVAEDGRVRTISPITFLNIRIARQIPGCGRRVAPLLWERGQLCDTLILSPPGLGKTTLLRDIIRLLSDGTGGQACMVGVVDERSELAACCQGIPQNDLGSRTDVLDGCPKAEGMMMLVRTMAPQVIAVDEVGSEEDCRAMEYVMNCGCRIIATAHASSLEELGLRPVFGRWLSERRFGRYVLIEREREEIFYRVCGKDGLTLWRGRRNEKC